MKAIRALVAAGADFDRKRGIDGATALLVACAMGHSRVASLLLKAGADKEEVRDDGATPLFVAAALSHNSIVQMLLDACADPTHGSTYYYGSPLEAAIEEGNTRGAALLRKAPKHRLCSESLG